MPPYDGFMKLLSLLVVSVMLVSCVDSHPLPSGTLVAPPDVGPDAQAESPGGAAAPCDRLSPDAPADCIALCAGSDSSFPPKEPGQCVGVRCPLTDGSTWMFSACLDP